MMSIFVMLVICIALIAGMGYAVFSLIKTGEASLGIQKDQARVENIAASIRASIKFADGRILLPVDVDGGPRAFVPSVAPYKTTASGKPIVYCPVSPQDISGTTVKMLEDGSETYDVEVTNYPDNSADSYVAAGAPAIDPAHLEKLRKKGVIAYLILPGPNTDEALNCEDAYIPEGVEDLVILADGGSVTPVLSVADEFSVGQHFTVADEDLGPNKAKDFASLKDVLDYVQAFDIPYATIWLPSSTEAILSELNDFFSTMKGKTVILKGNSSTISVTGEGTLSVSGTLFAESVDFNGGDNITLSAAPSGAIHLSGSTTGGIENVAGNITLENTSVTPKNPSAAPTITIDGGRTWIDGSSSIHAPNAIAAIYMTGGTLDVTGTPNVDLSAAGDIVIKSGSAIVTGKEFNVKRGGGVAAIEPLRQRVQATCADGSASCEATCPRSTKPVSGECLSTNNHPLAGFGASENSYVCNWSGLVGTQTVTGPSSIALCE